MAFQLIKGRFFPGVGIPDGDSVRFAADDISLWQRLRGSIDDPGLHDTVQLRFEGIDSIEKNALQPLALESRDSMFDLIGASAADPSPAGYVLARRVDDNGRPIAFVFAGDAPEPDGAEIFLDANRLRESVNYLQMRNGHAYPLYYDTLFQTLRRTLDEAVHEAKTNQRGYWQTDATMTGVHVFTRPDLSAIPPIWPKLWRRLEEFLRNRQGLAGFREFLKQSGERVDHLGTFEQSSFHHFVDVADDTVRLTADPGLLRVVSMVA